MIFKLKVESGKLKVGFTLAEVLITLVIIGVVAAITVPMLMNDTNDKQWNVARQKAQATIGEAFRLMTVNGEITDNLSTKEFVEQIIPKYLKLAKTCDNATECGFSENIKRPDGTNVLPPTTRSDVMYDRTYSVIKSATETTECESNTDNDTVKNYNTSYFFKTLDGYSVNLFYNPYCAANSQDKLSFYNGFQQLALDVFCFSAIYDMNGEKGPNTVGKDIGFVGSIYNGYETQAIAVLPYGSEKKIPAIDDDYVKGAVEYCKNLDKDDNWILPDLNEISLLYLYNKLIRDNNGVRIWSKTPLISDSNRYRFVHFSSGNRGYGVRTYSDPSVLCVRNNTLK